MKSSRWISILATPVIMIAINAWAHDPSEHMKNAEKPDCAAMEGMEHGKMDMNDPVMQAMMQQCMQDHHKGGHHMSGDASQEPATSSVQKAPAAHQHQH